MVIKQLSEIFLGIHLNLKLLPLHLMGPSVFGKLKTQTPKFLATTTEDLPTSWMMTKMTKMTLNNKIENKKFFHVQIFFFSFFLKLKKKNFKKNIKNKKNIKKMEIDLSSLYSDFIFQLDKFISPSIQNIKEKILKAYLWGSRVYKNNSPSSDWDISIILSSKDENAFMQKYSNPK